MSSGVHNLWVQLLNKGNLYLEPTSRSLVARAQMQRLLQVLLALTLSFVAAAFPSTSTSSDPVEYQSNVGGALILV